MTSFTAILWSILAITTAISIVEQQNIRGQSDDWRAICENDEESIIERRVGLTDDNSPVLTREVLLLLKLGELNRRIEYF
ncbi:hypothetical protein GQ600_6450 [Phytophthora cactorum]|nr:hypothetical protein GQ600_6450 [Phytophthora cactorum]